VRASTAWMVVCKHVCVALLLNDTPTDTESPYSEKLMQDMEKQAFGIPEGTKNH